ncbi:MAG: c-type cytochrome [Gemmatimonadetes bacterium]|nr:c-type cytochrome [Gemmatimonadota bacterium]MBP9107804.1 c-type cytochrome [Gemmatimonadaceae bacterium]
MKPIARKIVKVLGAFLLLVVAAALSGFAYVQATWDRDFSAVPMPAIVASRDSGTVARGEYLVRTVAHCAECHALASDPAAGIDGPLSGGFVFDIPVFGRYVAANITSDSATGIGALSDGQIARVIRSAIDRRGRFAPFMSFAVGEMSDEDLTAVVSYLRTQPAVPKVNATDEWGLAAKALSGMFEPRLTSPPAHVAAGGVSVERGRYLAMGPAACSTCHSPIDPLTFAPDGPPLSGSTQAEPDGAEPGFEFVIPNLTPDSATGHIASWSEDQFVARFRQGRVYKGSKMPWEAFRRLEDDDARSIYRYLRTLPPAHHEIGPQHRKVGATAGVK